MIKINKIEPQVVEHFNPNGESLGFLNELESTDLRCQIAEHKVEGYYLMFNNEKIPITSNGRINIWPDMLYDQTEKQLTRLFKGQRKQREDAQNKDK